MAFAQKRAGKRSSLLGRDGIDEKGLTISPDRLAEIQRQINGLKLAAQTEDSPSELRFRVLMGARTIRQLVERS